MRLVAGFAACLLALVAGGGAALWLERLAPARFAMTHGADDEAVWRLNRTTGQVSVCGTSLTGHALSEMELRLSAHIRAAGKDAAKRAALLPEIDELDGLARPRCSPWSAPDAHAELQLGAPE